MPTKGIIIKVSLATAIIFSVIFLPLIIIGIAKLIDPRQILQGCFFCAAYIFAVYWACSPTVFLEGKLLKYKTLFTSRSVNLDTITKVEASARPVAMLKLYRSEHSHPFQFIVKPFSKMGASSIIHYLRLNAKNAELDIVSSDMEKHNFDSITRQSLQIRNWLHIFLTLIMLALTLALLRAFHF